MTPVHDPEPEDNLERPKHNAAENLTVREQAPVCINAYKVDLSEAHIYKYVIDFSPDKYFSRKEKGILARRFLEYVALDLDTVDVVVGDNFEFFLPHPNAELSQRYLQVAFSRSNSRKGGRGSIKSFVRCESQPVYSEFVFSSDLGDKASRTDDATSVPRTFAGFELCKVSARGPLFHLNSLLASNESGSKDSVLAAVTKIFKRSPAPMISWYGKCKVGAVKGLREMGSKVFDFLELSDEEPVHVGSGFEVRRGINASTELMGNSIFRVVTPTHRVFFEEGINLAELVLQIVGTVNPDESTYSLLKELLKGMTIIKTYGTKSMKQIVDLGRRPSDLTIVCGEREHGQNIHIDYANLPCIKVSNSKIDEFLPMSLCIVASGQKAQLSLLAEMKVVSEADLKIIQCKIRNSASQMEDAQTNYAGKFLRELMSSQTLVAFNIKINNVANSNPSIARIMEQAKTHATLDAEACRRKTREAKCSLSSRLSGISVVALLFTQRTPGGFQSIVQQLFGAHGVQVKEVKMMNGPPKGDRLKKLAEQTADESVIVCGIWSRAHKTDSAVKEAYEKIKSLCAGEGMATISVQDLGASLGQPADIKRVGNALHKLLAKREFLVLSVDTASCEARPHSVLLAIYVTAVPDPQSKKRQPNVKLGEEGESNAQCRRRKKSLTRSFLVTLVLSDGTSGAFCRSKTLLQAWTPAGDGQQADSPTYPGVHKLDDANLEALFSFLSATVKVKRQVTILRAGVRPSDTTANPNQQLNAEIEFWKAWATQKSIELSYYTVSSSSHATLSPHPCSSATHTGLSHGDHSTTPTSDVTLLVDPSFPGANKWLLQKQTAKGTQPRSVSLTAHLVPPSTEYLLGSDEMVSAASWNFPPSTWSSKELAPVYLARKAARALMRTFDADAKSGPAVPSDYTAEKLQKIQDDLKYPIYLD